MTRRGRPRSFDREKALQMAKDLFWARGYVGATLPDLQKAMGGITAPSFYAAFGSKEELFREAVALHGKTEGAAALHALNGQPSARASIEAMLYVVAETFCQPGKPRGCMIVLGAINCAPDDRSVQNHLRDLRLMRQKYIRRRLERGVADGDLSRGLDLTGLASFYSTVVDGLAIQARDGASRSALKDIVRCAMASWDELVVSKKRRSK